MLGPQNSNRGYRKIEPPVGEGSFGKVYKCKALDGTLYAWKEVRISHKSEGAALMREVSALRALQHPNIVRLLDSWIEANKLILILELCDEDLADRIEAGPLEQRLILEYAVQVLLALEFMHSHNYIHRDIKPENVLLKNGQVKLADFGIARLIEGMPAKTYAGTPCFMAPEVSRGSYDSKADMFSFGTMLYQCISGEYMFNDEPKNFQSVRPYNAYVITALSKLSPKLDARLVQTLHRTLPWNPSERLTAGQILDAIGHKPLGSLYVSCSQSKEDLVARVSTLQDALREAQERVKALEKREVSRACQAAVANERAARDIAQQRKENEALTQQIKTLEAESRASRHKIEELIARAVVAEASAKHLEEEVGNLRKKITDNETTACQAPAQTSTTTLAPEPATSEAVISPPTAFRVVTDRTLDEAFLDHDKVGALSKPLRPEQFGIPLKTTMKDTQKFGFEGPPLTKRLAGLDLALQ